jgi:hypothetical protein
MISHKRIAILAPALAVTTAAIAAEQTQSDTVTFIHVFSGMKYLAIWLLFINIILVSAVILLAFRTAILKERVDELEAELGRSVIDVLNNPISDDRPITPSPSRRKRMSWRL